MLISLQLDFLKYLKLHTVIPNQILVQQILLDSKTHLFFSNQIQARI